jgi:putative Holliday junction resolvase
VEPATGGRALGLDLGQVRIGVAISDDGRRLALPFGTIHTGAPHDVKAVAALVQEHGIGTVVVGLPLSLKGERGAAAAHAERFAEALHGVLSIPVVLHDERLSTVEAGRALREGGTPGRRRRDRIDASAATVILQSWLDATRER